MYDPYVKEKIMAFLTDLTSEYRRVMKREQDIQM